MILEEGRPENIYGREECEIRTYDLLDALGITYGRVEHSPAQTMEDCVEIDRILKAPMCKNLFLCNRQKTDFYLLLMPGDKPFKTKELSAQLGTARLSFADEANMLELLDIKPGSVSVMGLANDKEGRVQLLIDDDLLKAEWLGCHPCVNTASLRIKTENILNVFLPAVKHRPITVKLTGE